MTISIMNARREPPRRRAIVNVITTIADTRFSHAPRENENRMPAARTPKQKIWVGRLSRSSRGCRLSWARISAAGIRYGP